MARFMRSEKDTEQKNSEPNEDKTNTASAPARQQNAAKPAARSAEPSIVSASLKITGNLESDAEIQLDGTVEGDVRGKVVTVGEGANITGSVYGETVNVAGTIDGKIEGRTVVIGKTAHTTGDIVHETLQVEAGAYVDGHCRPEYGKTDTKRGFPQPSGPAHQPDIKAVEKPAGPAEASGPAAV